MRRDRTLMIAMLGAILCLCAGPASAQWTAHGPGPRYLHSAVFDSSTDQMIVFGGTDYGTTNYNDLWVTVNVMNSDCNPTCDLDWVYDTPTGTPPAARSGHTAVYDSTNSRMIVFGGATGFPTPCVNDVWVLENANGVAGNPTWTELNPGGTPPPAREGQVAAYDATTNTMTIFGGTDCNGNYLNDAWAMMNANGLGGTPKWKELAPTGTLPPGRAYMAAAFNATANTLTVYGGTNNPASNFLSDVWLLSGANGTGKTSSWKELSPQGTAPPARYGPATGYDSTNNILMIAGGQTPEGLLGDTWLLQNADNSGGTPTWVQVSPTHVGSQLYYSSGIYDPTTNQMVEFAGLFHKAPTPTTADDHVFVLTDANGLSGSDRRQ
jgi:hypothetical protein